MNIKVSDALSVIEGLEPIDPALLEEFKRAMTEDAIPKIVIAVERRQIRAAEAREWQLNCWPTVSRKQAVSISAPAATLHSTPRPRNHCRSWASEHCRGVD